MSDNSYELVFYGTLVEGFSESQTKQHVAQLFKTSIDQVERMFTGKRVVIRNKLDNETALKYIQAMKKRGAECQIEVMGAPGVKVDLAQAVPPQAVPPQTTSSPSSAPQAAATPTQAQTAPQTPVQSFAQSPTKNSAEKVPNPVKTDNASGLSIAGEKVDEILSHAHFALDPVGIRLTDEKPEVNDEHHALDNVSLAPVGADLCDEKPDIPVSLPDVSGLSLEPEKD